MEMGYWPWYIAGPLIGLFVPLLLIFGNKQFGISSSFLHICNLALPSDKRSFLKYNAKKDGWKFYFIIGIVIGAYITVKFFSSGSPEYLPTEYFTHKGYLKLLIGGLLVGFGTRYANGCTSGHSITGISLLNFASFKATIAFFAGGLAYTWLAYLL